MLLLFAAVAGVVAAQARSAAEPSTVVVQLLAINDFHGHLEPPGGANGRIGNTPAGGSEYLGAAINHAIAENPNSLVVAAGDLIGASPLLSALFHDEPAIEAMNAMHLSVASVGNHEFDEGWRELLRMQHGGCHPADGCQDHDGFDGAAFSYLAANVTTGGAAAATLFPAVAVRTVGGVKVGFIGETLKGTPRIVAPSAVQGLTFLDEASTANLYAAQLKRQGVNAIVLLIHEGLEVGEDPKHPDGCTNPRGGLMAIVKGLSADVKVVVSGHTHQFYNCTIDGHTVTSASSYGRMLTRINMTMDRATGAVIGVAARNQVVDRRNGKDAAQSRIIAKYSPIAAPIAGRVVGSVRSPLTRRATTAGESALGDVIADAQLAAAAPAERGGATIALMNPGGIRADVGGVGGVGGSRGRGADAGRIIYGDLFASQPFSNALTVMTISGETLRRVLEQQFENPAPGSATILQVSAGFAYTYALHAPAGQHVDAPSIRLNGRAIAPTDRLRLVVNSFLAAGGDGFKALTEGANQLGGDIDVDALVAYFQKHSPVDPGPQSRITVSDY